METMRSITYISYNAVIMIYKDDAIVQLTMYIPHDCTGSTSYRNNGNLKYVPKGRFLPEFPVRTDSYEGEVGFRSALEVSFS